MSLVSSRGIESVFNADDDDVGIDKVEALTLTLGRGACFFILPSS